MPSTPAAEAPYLALAGTVLRHLSPGSRILDFGSGPCDKTAVLQFLGFHCSAYDDLKDHWHGLAGNREAILSFARDCGIDFRLADGGPPPFDMGSFDMLMLRDVLEHLHDSPRDLLNDLLELVKPEGLLLVAVPNAANIRKRISLLLGGTNMPRFEGFYWYPGPWRGHVREYVKGDLAKLAECLNLQVLELRGCDHMLQKVPTPARGLYRLMTGLFPGWKDSWMLVARKQQGWAPRKSLPDDQLAAILNQATNYSYSE